MTERLAQKSAAKDAAILAKVGFKGKTPHRLAARMPSPEVASKVGMTAVSSGETRRVMRRKARG